MVIVEQIIELTAELSKNAESFNKGNKAAGARVRKNLLDIKNLAHQGRLEVSAIKNAETEV